jgi:hypothetical protein
MKIKSALYLGVATLAVAVLRSVCRRGSMRSKT